jgi:hypothetical protein
VQGTCGNDRDSGKSECQLGEIGTTPDADESCREGSKGLFKQIS